MQVPSRRVISPTMYVAPTGLVEHAAALREYRTDACGRAYTLPELTEVFIAHAANWNHLGATKAWWSVLTGGFKPKSEISRAEQRRFYNTGEAHVARVLRELTLRQDVLAAKYGEEHSRPSHSDAVKLEGYHRGRHRTALDFGCGLGRLAFSFAAQFDRVLCVDQSVQHLRRAREATGALNASHADRIDFITSTPDLLAALRGRRADVVHSVIALQHMVTPLQAVYFEQLCDALRPGGLGWLHYVSEISGGAGRAAAGCDLESSIRGSLEGMQMHALPASDAVRALQRRNCTVWRNLKDPPAPGVPHGKYRNRIVLFGKQSAM